MDRRVFLLVAVLGCLGNAGCLREWLGDKPREPKVSVAHVETSRRVDELTKRIVDQNTFTGLEPIVTVLGIPEAALFHRGPNQLFISEGLVKKCKTDAELAAVLCSELGQMMAQKQAGAVVRPERDRDPIPPAALPGGQDAGSVRDAELALQEKRERAKRAREQSNSVQLAKELLQGAGFDAAELDRVEPMTKQSERGEAIKRQMAGAAPAPTWNR